MTRSHSQPPCVGVIFLGRKRTGFDPAWGEAMTGRVRACLRELSLPTVEPSVKVVDEASLGQAVSACAAQGAEVLLTLQTTMSDARLSRVITQLWPDPLILWATPENPQGDMISSCSLVGVHNWATNLAHQGARFLLVYGSPEEPSTRRQIEDAIRQAAALRRLRRARLTVIGGQAPGFFHMAPDAAALYRCFGAQLQHFSLVQFLEVLNGLTEAAVAADLAAVKALGLPHRNSRPEDLPMASRLYLTMRHFFEQEATDALAVRCWPELPNVTGQWPYLGMARLTDEGRPVAPEGDGDGAWLALIGQSLGLGPAYLTDWLEHDAETITCWHAGCLPFGLSPAVGSAGGPVLANHFNIAKPLVVESQLLTGIPVTVARLWNRNGRYLLTVAEGESVPVRRRLMGSQGLVRLSDRSPHRWFTDLCRAGMPHHILVFRGHHRAMLESFAALTDVDCL